MIAPPSSTPETMRNAYIFTLGALDAAAALDIDRTADDRAFFASEKAALELIYKNLISADNAVQEHQAEGRRLQAYVLLGDLVLDRGVRNAKARVRLDLKLSRPAEPDLIFGSNIEEVVDTELRFEPSLVMKIADRLGQADDFPGRDAIKKDLEQRAEQQKKALEERDAGDLAKASLAVALDRAISEGSDALYRLEKRLLERFLREKQYVRTFFLDVLPPRKPKPKPETPA